MKLESLQYANRFDHVSGSAIRDIFKIIAQPGMISFAGGNPSLAALPDHQAAEIARQVLLDNGKAILQYGATEGYAPLLESLKSWIPATLGIDVPGILPVTGSTQAMDRLGVDAIAKARKPIIGYSDISVYHAAWTKAGQPSIHACMSETFTSLAEECREAEARILKGEIPRYQFESTAEGVDGEAVGVLVGGNLATFSAVLGAEYDSTRMGKPYILFLEEVGGNFRQIHRSLTIMKHVGVLDRAAGIVFGEWTELPTDGTGSFGAERGGDFESVADMIRREFLADVHVPVAFGFPAGHGDVNYPLLMGVNVKLKKKKKNCTLDWRQ